MSKLAVADSAEIKTVDYLFRKGWSGLRPGIKGPNSVLHGISTLLERKLNITPRSRNLIKELQTYMWDTTIDGAYTNTPVKHNDHALDALRYLYSYPAKKQIRIV